MFAFVLYDPRTNRLFGARDRMGKKPFYYYHSGQTFVFGSEPKALLAHPAVSRDIDWEAATRYLLYEYAPGPHAIYREIRKQPAGHAFQFHRTRGLLTLTQHRDCSFMAAVP